MQWVAAPALPTPLTWTATACAPTAGGGGGATLYALGGFGQTSPAVAALLRGCHKKGRVRALGFRGNELSILGHFRRVSVHPALRTEDTAADQSMDSSKRWRVG